MDGPGDIRNAAPAQVDNGPPNYRAVGRYAICPETCHDSMK
jgi:hypothetical protein